VSSKTREEFPKKPLPPWRDWRPGKGSHRRGESHSSSALAEIEVANRYRSPSSSAKAWHDDITKKLQVGLSGWPGQQRRGRFLHRPFVKENGFKKVAIVRRTPTGRRHCRTVGNEPEDMNIPHHPEGGAGGERLLYRADQAQKREPGHHPRYIYGPAALLHQPGQ